MKKISVDRALEEAYKNLYNSKLDQIDKRLDQLLKAKKFACRQQNKKNKEE